VFYISGPTCNSAVSNFVAQLHVFSKIILSTVLFNTSDTEENLSSLLGIPLISKSFLGDTVRKVTAAFRYTVHLQVMYIHLCLDACLNFLPITYLFNLKIMLP